MLLVIFFQNVFYYGKPHPQLPQMLYNEDEITPFQVYPIESFYLPPKFEKAFRNEQSGVIRYNAAQPGSRLTLLDRFTPSSTLHYQSR